MTVYAITSYLFRSLFSRPRDLSTDRYIANLIEHNRRPGSDLLLFQDLLINNDNQRSCTESLLENQLQRIYDTSAEGFGRRPRHDVTVTVTGRGRGGGGRSGGITPVIRRGRMDYPNMSQHFLTSSIKQV
ncbi:hypothetical protein MFLAVUS_002720 [Mucor flavus]|uniref:Uncharacterized protein n=1 Tax=Mucor flavus TaxID=439312 RepID=A0ABP9YR34_9FUNG